MVITRYNDFHSLQRSLLLFENSCRSPHTLKMYKYHLERFVKFTKIRDYDSLASLDTETIQTLLENYAIHLKRKGLSGKAVEDYFSGIELFFECNKKFYYKKALHKLFPEKRKSGNYNPYTTQDIQKLLACTSNKRAKALIHFFGSTGVRPSALLDPVLCFKHVYQMPLNCKAILIYADSTEEYYCFLTPEASKALDDYRDERIRNGEAITPESPVFRYKSPLYRKGNNQKNLTYQGALQIIRNALRISGIERIKQGARYDKAFIYGFRKRFNTIMKLNNEVNSNIVEKLMAHKKGLDGVYFKPTREECFAEFVKAIPELTVDESERLKEQLKKQSQELKVQSDKDKRITDLESKLEIVYKLLSRYDKNV